MNGNGCTIGNRLLVHLSCYSRYKDEYVCPMEMTQDGMSQRLGISRAHAALELKRLKGRNQVEYRLAHVVKAKTRRKVYELTPAGERIADEVKDKARRKKVRLLDGNGGMECTGIDAIRLLCSRGLTETEAFSRILMSEAVHVAADLKIVRAEGGEEGFFGRDQEIAKLRRWLGSPGKAVCVLTGSDGMGKSTLARRLISGAHGISIWKNVRPMQSACLLLSEIAEVLETEGKGHLAGLLKVERFDLREAAMALAEDMAGGLLVLDDLHNSTEPEEFAALFLAMNDWPLKVLLASRRKPGFCKRWADTFQRPYEDISLSGLDIESARMLVAMHGMSLTDDAIMSMHASCQGRPLDLTLLAEAGSQSGGTDVSVGLDGILSALGDEEIALIKLAAILDKPVDPAAITLTPAQSATLKRRSLFSEAEGGFALHDLLKVAIIQRMEDCERRAMHEKAAIIEEMKGDNLSAARHHLAAGMRDRAVAAVERSGCSIRFRESGEELIELVRSIGDADSLQSILGGALESRGRLDEARQCLERAAAGEHEVALADILLHLAKIEIRLSRFDEAEKHAAAAFAQFNGSKDEVGRGRALQSLAGIQEGRGKVGEAGKHLRSAIDAFEAAGECARAIDCRIRLGELELKSGNPTGAVAILTNVVQSPIILPPQSASASYILGRACGEMRDWEHAIAHFVKSEQTATSSGFYRIAAVSLSAAAEGCVSAGKTEEAEEFCRKALKLAERLDDIALLSEVHATLGRLNRNRGLWKRAESHIMTSISLLKALKASRDLADRYRDLASLYETTGDSRKARLWNTRAEKMEEWEEPSPGSIWPTRASSS